MMKFKYRLVLCAVLLYVFITGFQIFDGTQPDRQLLQQGNSYDENTLNRVDIHAAINKEKLLGKANYDVELQLANSLKEASGVSTLQLANSLKDASGVSTLQLANSLKDASTLQLANSLKDASGASMLQLAKSLKDAHDVSRASQESEREEAKVISNKTVERNAKLHVDDSAKHAKDNEFDEVLNDDNEVDQALEFKENSVFDQELEFKEDQFQNITEDGSYVVYNAYIDGPKRDWIRAVGFSRQLNPTVNLHCLFWDDNMNAVSMTTSVTIQMIPRNTLQRFKDAIFLCPIPVKNVSGVTIEATGSSGRTPLNLMKIRESHKANRTFTICLRPIHFRETAAYDIVEWVEYYRLMGVDYFMIYNFTSDPLTDKILNYYVDSGIVEVVQWHLPHHVIPSIQYYELEKYKGQTTTGQFAMLNDFLYRVYWSTEYVINVDLDEFIVPLDGSKNFRQLLNTYSPSCEYQFRNSLVPINTVPSNQRFADRALAMKYRLKTVLYTKRQDYVYKGFKTKYIARTNCSQLLWIHFVWEKRAPYTEVPTIDGQHVSKDFMKNKVVLKETSSIVFHYRMPFESKTFIRRHAYIEDGRFQPFVKGLIDRVKTVWGHNSVG